MLPVTYRKSSFSSMTCVEVASTDDGTISVRNTRARSGPTLEYTREEWIAFVAGVKSGEFDFGLDIDSVLTKTH